MNRFQIVLSSMIFLGLVPVVSAAPQYEATESLVASDVLGQALDSENYQVDPVVTNDGKFNHFQVDAYDVKEAVSTNDWARERLYEADAIQVLRDIKETDAYKKGFDAALEAPMALTRNTLNDPVKTLESIPAGLSNLLNDIGAAISSSGKSKTEEDNAFMKDLIGFNTVKRRLAAEIGVDVYSSNALLQKELDDVAWSMFAGGAVIDVALTAAPLVASLAVRASDRSNTGQLNWKIPPATLQQAMIKAIRPHGLTGDEIQSLVFHASCNLNHVSAITTNLTSLGEVKGVAEVYRQVAGLKDELSCRHYRKLVQQAYLYHVNKSPVNTIQQAEDGLIITDESGRQVQMVVNDKLYYQLENEALFSTTNDLWLTGGATQAAMTVLQDNGVKAEVDTLTAYQAPLDIVAVLMPERAKQIVEGQDETNRTRKMVDGVTQGVGDVVGGVLGTLTSPLKGSTADQNEATQDEPVED